MDMPHSVRSYPASAGDAVPRMSEIAAMLTKRRRIDCSIRQALRLLPSHDLKNRVQLDTVPRAADLTVALVEEEHAADAHRDWLGRLLRRGVRRRGQDAQQLIAGGVEQRPCCDARHAARARELGDHRYVVAADDHVDVLIGL